MRASPKSGDRGRGGAALVIIMIIIMVMAIAGASMMGMASQQVHSVQRLINRIKAEAIAEAGVAEAYAILRDDFSKRQDDDAFPGKEFAGGVYDACVSEFGDDMARIWCKGEYPVPGDDIVGFYVGMNVKDFSPGGEGNAPPTSPWAHSIFVNGRLTHNGAGILIGSVRCNNRIRCNGAFIWGTDSQDCDVYAYTRFRACGVAVVKGTVYSPDIKVCGVGSIREKVIGPIELVEFPVLDLTPYYQIAEEHGQVFSGQTYNGSHSWGEIPGGVRWFNGNLRVNGTLSYAGCIIATGYIKFNGAINQTQVGDLPAVISRDSYIKVNGASIFHGLIYAGGDITYNGAELLEGALLCGGNARFNGAYGQIAYSYSEPGGPEEGGGDSDAEVGVTAWYR